MTVLIWYVVAAVVTVLLLFLRWQTCCRHHPRPKHSLVPVRPERLPQAPYSVHYRRQLEATRTIALATLPMPIRGEIEVARSGRHRLIETAPTPRLLNDLSFATPDIALMRRVLEGLRALPDRPREPCPRARSADSGSVT
jgi:hypothetical protein